MTTYSACISIFESDVTVLAPERSPAVSHLPVAYSSAHYQSVVISVGTACLQYASVVIPPLPGVNPNYGWSSLQSISQLLTPTFFPPAFDAELIFSTFFALTRLGLINRADIGIVVISGDTRFEDIVEDVPRSFLFQALGTAIDNFLFRQSDPIISQLYFLTHLPSFNNLLTINLKFHKCNRGKDVASIIIFHIFNWWHKLFPVIIIIILKLCNFLITFLSSDGGDNGVQFLELLLRDIVLLVQSFFEFLV